MMRTLRTLPALAIALLLTTAAVADPPALELQTDEAALLTAEEWVGYSERVSDALHADIDGLQEAALRMTVLYAENLSLDRMDTIEMVRIFRDHENTAMRRLAVVALNAADDHWGIDMLARSYRFEDVPCIRYQIGAVLLDHATRHATVEIEEEPRVIKVWPVS